METRQLLQLLAHGNTDEFNRAMALSSATEYAVLLQGLAEEQDDKLVFWCLEILLHEHQTQLLLDADNVIPLLIGRLSWESGPVYDRASRLLNGLGKPALTALLDAIEAAPDTQRLVARTAALRRNPSLHLLASQVLDLLGRQLDNPDRDVQFWTLAVLMDSGPLRPWFDNRLSKAAFETLYPKLLNLASQLKTQQQYSFAETYEQLLMQHLYCP